MILLYHTTMHLKKFLRVRHLIKHRSKGLLIFSKVPIYEYKREVKEIVMIGAGYGDQKTHHPFLIGQDWK